VLSGDSPDGSGPTVRANGDGLFPSLWSEVPVGGPLTEAGQPPALTCLKHALSAGVHDCSGFRKNTDTPFGQPVARDACA